MDQVRDLLYEGSKFLLFLDGSELPMLVIIDNSSNRIWNRVAVELFSSLMMDVET